MDKFEGPFEEGSRWAPSVGERPRRHALQRRADRRGRPRSPPSDRRGLQRHSNGGLRRARRLAARRSTSPRRHLQVQALRELAVASRRARFRRKRPRPPPRDTRTLRGHTRWHRASDRCPPWSPKRALRGIAFPRRAKPSNAPRFGKSWRSTYHSEFFRLFLRRGLVLPIRGRLAPGPSQTALLTLR